VLAQRCSPPPSASMHGKAGSVAAKYRITRCGPMRRLVRPRAFSSCCATDGQGQPRSDATSSSSWSSQKVW
jgi:hypothetical protein